MLPASCVKLLCGVASDEAHEHKTSDQPIIRTFDPDLLILELAGNQGI